MTSTDARYLAFELWKLLRTGERFSDLQRRYDRWRKLLDLIRNDPDKSHRILEPRP